LNHGAQLLAEQYGRQLGGRVGQRIQVQLQAAVAGKGHLQQGGDQATVGAVVVGKQLAVGVEPLDHGEEGLQVFRIVQVRHLLAELGMGLRQDGGAEAVLAAAQVDQQQIGFAFVEA